MSNQPTPARKPCPVCGLSFRRESCKPLAHRDQYHSESEGVRMNTLPDCLDGTIFNGAAIERQLKKERDDAQENRCACGGKLKYRPAVGAYSCYHGSLYRAGGSQVVRECPKAKKESA